MTRKIALLGLLAATVAGAALAQAPAGPGPHGPDRERPPFAPVADFAAADTDGDGALTAEELAADMLARMEEPTARRAARMVEFLDRDGDGKLTEEEMTPERPDPFAAMDTDGDGQISRAEFDAMAERMREMRAERGPRGPRPPMPPAPPAAPAE